MNPDERLLGQARIQASDQQTVQLCRPQRPDLQVAQTAVGEGPLEIEGQRGRALESPGHEQANSLVSQAASHERKHALRLGIEPLDIVDPHDGRAFARDHAEYP